MFSHRHIYSVLIYLVHFRKKFRYSGAKCLDRSPKDDRLFSAKGSHYRGNVSCSFPAAHSFSCIVSSLVVQVFLFFFRAGCVIWRVDRSRIAKYRLLSVHLMPDCVSRIFSLTRFQWPSVTSSFTFVFY